MRLARSAWYTESFMPMPAGAAAMAMRGSCSVTGPKLPVAADKTENPGALFADGQSAPAFVPAGNGQPAYSYAVGQPHYQATASVPSSSNYCESDKLPVTARRTVTVDGQVITFSRSVNL